MAVERTQRPFNLAGVVRDGFLEEVMSKLGFEG